MTTELESPVAPACSTEDEVANYYRHSVSRREGSHVSSWHTLLPRLLETFGVKHKKAADPNAPPAPFKVLLVDDHPDSVEALVRMFRKTGYEADCVESAAAALSKLDMDRPAVLVVDVMMPEMDGVELLKAIRSRAGCEKLPVLMLTADPRRAREALTLGAQDYILKPPDFERLRASVDRYRH
jgi:CheY-like chemotaxis protein